MRRLKLYPIAIVEHFKNPPVNALSHVPLMYPPATHVADHHYKPNCWKPNLSLLHAET